jgi:hypothetical protein
MSETNGEEQTIQSSRMQRLALTALVSLCLLSLYIVFLYYVGIALLAAPQSPVESLIFYTMILRVLVVVFVPKLRRSYPQLKIALFSLETFVLVALIFIFIYTQAPVYDLLIGQVLTAWLGASSIILSPYLVYQIGASMYKGTNASSLVFSVTPEFAVNLFLAGFAIANSASPPSGIINFGTLLVGSIKAESNVLNLQPLVANPYFVLVTIVLYLSLLCYIAIGQFSTSGVILLAAVKRQFQLVLILVGTFASFLWIVISPSFFGTDEVFVLSIPTVVISSVLWGIARRGRDKD